MADFITGDNKAIFERQLIDVKTGNPYDLTGYTAQLRFRINNGTLKLRSMTILAPETNGIVQYKWIIGDLDAAGDVEAEIRITESGEWLTTKDVIKLVTRAAIN